MKLVNDDPSRMLEFFVHEEFDDISDDRLLSEYFCKYFKDNILAKSFSSSDLYLTDDEKSLQYSGKNKVEPLFEYHLLIRDAKSKSTKSHYAEKGAVFAIVHPVVHPNMTENKRFYADSASAFYSLVSSNSRDADSSDFFDFVSGLTVDMMNGLENILENLFRDGTKSLEKAYAMTLVNYSIESESEKKNEYAQLLVNLSRRIGLSPDDVPLEKNHYRLFFE
ncbi:MAG: hypothetical protein ACOCUR_02575 [Nanoarchaeota archaeon]